MQTFIYHNKLFCFSYLAYNQIETDTQAFDVWQKSFHLCLGNKFEAVILS